MCLSFYRMSLNCQILNCNVLARPKMCFMWPTKWIKNTCLACEEWGHWKRNCTRGQRNIECWMGPPKVGPRQEEANPCREEDPFMNPNSSCSSCPSWLCWIILVGCFWMPPFSEKGGRMTTAAEIHFTTLDNMEKKNSHIPEKNKGILMQPHILYGTERIKSAEKLSKIHVSVVSLHLPLNRIQIPKFKF